MSIGIIAEYNPFHNGHIFQLEYAKKKWPNENIIIIMSGKYVQRGEIAIATFEERKKMALKYGASKVIELPFEYATQAAHIFASGAVKIANENGINKLLFGSESDDVDNLILIAKTIKNRKSEYKKLLKSNLKTGLSFPKSAADALTKLIGENITLPNDILGLEYIKAIIENDYNIEPYSIKRTVEFHSDETNEKFASASLIRKMIKNGEDVSKYTPMKLNSDFEKIEDYYKEFQKIVKETPPEELAKSKMISEGMENLFKKHIDAKTYEEFVDRTNSKRYTSSRIKRVMLYVLLKK
ncbi:MAG: nucleotidyltransferase [Mycoplasma sp.]|nr:nucleotidyltransferase [Mycoplasma sp.]